MRAIPSSCLTSHSATRGYNKLEVHLLDMILTRMCAGRVSGTGKTTVAKVYGQLLAEMGLLSKGEVLCKVSSDFTGDVIGSSEKNTRDILRAAEGCVLVIDEAYSLCQGMRTGPSP